MNETWDILRKELSFHDFRPIEGGVEFHSGNEIKRYTYEKAYDMLSEEALENTEVLRLLWTEISSLLVANSLQDHAHDPKEIRLFISSLKDLAKFIDMFNPEESGLQLSTIKQALDTDIIRFSPEAISKIIDCKISLDWTHRVVSKILYVRRLIRFASQGRMDVNQTKIVLARGISGPWANLDLPIRERVWEWWEEDENLRNRDKDTRMQRRYRKGHENYNNDGRVGEGHYWRELRNEPYSWYSSQNDSPYPMRSVLRWN
jgi:hypothetical protein